MMDIFPPSEAGGCLHPAEASSDPHLPVCSPVNGVCVVGVEVLDALLQLVTAFAFLDAEVEQVDVGVQGELVHGVDAAHVVQDGEQDGGPLGTRPVGLRGDRKLPSA